MQLRQAPDARSAAAAAAAAPSAAAAAAAASAPLPQRLLAWLAPDDAGGTAGSALSPAAASAEALSVRHQHLATENKFLRERISMVEATVQPLLAEVSEKRALLHHAYVLCHRQLLRDPLPGEGEVCRVAASHATPEQVNQWVRSGLPGVMPRDAARSESEVADAMEAVLEDTLRLNITLNHELEALKHGAALVGAALVAEATPTPSAGADEAPTRPSRGNSVGEAVAARAGAPSTALNLYS